MNMVVNSEIEGADGFWQRGRESCRAALVIAPDSIPAVSSLARLTQDWAYWTARGGGDPEPLFASSLQLSERLLELDGGARGLAALAWHHTNYAVWKYRSGQAFRPDLERSVELLRQADALAPGEGSVRNSLVQTLAFRATRDLEDGFDASETTFEGLELARLEFADGVSIQSLNNLATLTVLYSRSQERQGIDTRDLLTEVLGHAESMAAEGHDVERALGRLRDRLGEVAVGSE